MSTPDTVPVGGDAAGVAQKTLLDAMPTVSTTPFQKESSRTGFKVCWLKVLIPVSVPVLFNGCGRNWLSNVELNTQDRALVASLIAI